jgi:predicted Zn-dependent protease
VLCVFHDKSAYLVAGQARTSEAFDKHREAFDAALGSFHPLTDTERVLARPLRMRVVTAREGVTFAELARGSPLGRFAEGHLRVLNGLYPTGEPVAGQSLKVVE